MAKLMTNKLWVIAVGLGSFAGLSACSDGAATLAGDGGYGNSAGDTSANGGDGALAGSAGSANPSGGSAGVGTVPPGAAIGAACAATEDCRVGLTCQDMACAPGHLLAGGAACVVSDECVDGMQCFSGTCTPGGSGKAGDACQSDLDCGSGFRCALSGLSLSCVAEGTSDVGGACKLSADCYAALGCAAGMCAITPPAGLFGEPWPGVSCSPPEKDGARAYFEVPGAANAQEGDFFRLPFPNDVRSASGALDLSGFPTPGAALLGFDPVQRYVDAVTATDSAWGAYPAVTFRFSGPLDGDTLISDNIHLHDITPGVKSPDDGFWQSRAGSARTAYVCDNWLAMERWHGHPLQPGHTYAFWLSTAIKAAGGAAVQRSENLLSLLADTAPTDAKLKAPYAAYKPFRDFIKAGGTRAPQSAAEVLNVAVVTVGAIRDPMKALAAAVTAEPLPTTHDWVKCQSGVSSPCPQAEGDRACGTPNAAFDEYQALVSLPIFQRGYPKGEPYLSPTDGGEIKLGSPAPREDVCLALTIPKGKVMPAKGWPVAIFAHGTGGSFRSHVTDDTAGVLAQATPAFAVLGIDQVEHGPRRGKSSAAPNDLFFNFENPSAARGNPLQGAADQLSLVRLAAAFKLSAAQTGGDAIQFDKDSIVFWGHSQGATEGSLAMPYADGVKAVVLSGNGATLKFALLNKTSPVNIAAALPFALQDPALATADESAEMHPVLTLLQQWIDPADPLHFAQAITRLPEPGHTAKNVFQTYGLGDTYAPPVTLREYALAGGLALVAADPSAKSPDAIDGATDVPAGVAGNVTVANLKYTLGVREYGPPKGDDGHFVAFDVPSANADVVRFLSAGVGTTPPPIGK
jgi:hypothetical protein